MLEYRLLTGYEPIPQDTFSDCWCLRHTLLNAIHYFRTIANSHFWQCTYRAELPKSAQGNAIPRRTRHKSGGVQAHHVLTLMLVWICHYSMTFDMSIFTPTSSHPQKTPSESVNEQTLWSVIKEHFLGKTPREGKATQNISVTTIDPTDVGVDYSRPDCMEPSLRAVNSRFPMRPASSWRPFHQFEYVL